MTLVDTSVWVEHFRQAQPQLTALLQQRLVLRHPLVVGEIAMGSLKQRSTTLGALQELRTSAVSTHAEVLLLVERQALYSRGLSYIDAHLLAAARITPRCSLWSYDKRLQAAAAELGIASPLGTIH